MNYKTEINYNKLDNVVFENIDWRDAPDFVDAYIAEAKYNGEYLTDRELENIPDDVKHELLMKHLH